MGEAKRKDLWRKRVRDGLEECVYCGAPSASVDHMPPRNLFVRKDRPPGMEFASCSSCNYGSAHAEQLVAFMARVSLDHPSDADRAEWIASMQAVHNNNPGLLARMQQSRARSKLDLSSIGLPHSFGAFRVTDELHGAMLLWTAKLGFAVHQEARQTRVPDEGAVVALWLSNAETMRGVDFSALDQFLGPMRYLAQGRKGSPDAFRYRLGETIEGHLTIRASLRSSGMDLLAVASIQPDFLDWASQRFAPEHIWRPGSLRIAVDP